MIDDAIRSHAARDPDDYARFSVLTVLGYAAVLVVGAIVVAVFWDSFVRDRRGPALVTSVLALTAVLAAGWLKADDRAVWPWVLLLTALALSGISELLRTRSRRD
jgi:hypothetical protein